MHETFRALFSGSISKTLMHILIFALLLPILLIIAISFMSMAENNYENAVSENQMVSRQIAKHFEFYFDSIDSLGLDIYRNNLIYTSLTAPGSNATITKSTKDHFFTNLLIKNEDSACLHYRSFIDDYETTASYGITFGNNQGISPFEKDYFSQFYIFDYCDYTVEDSFEFLPVSTEKGDLIIYYRVIFNVFEKEPVGELYITFLTDFIKEACSFYRTDPRDALVLYSLGSNCPVYSNEAVTPELLSDVEPVFANADENGVFRRIEHDRTTMLTFFARVPGYDMVVLKAIPAKAIQLPFNRTMLLLIPMAILSIMVAFLFSRSITRPIKALRDAMHRVKQGEYGRQIDASSLSDNEIVQAVGTFNQMTCEIDRLINESLLTKIELQQARLNELQSIINPHFISNTLQSISGMAVKHNAYDVKYALEIFSDLMRYSINAESPGVPLRSEIEHARKYLVLHKLRLGERLNFSLEHSAEVSDISIPRLTLQPLIENCICHGLSAGDRPLNIFVSAKLEGEYLIISVCDDGAGFLATQDELLVRPRIVSDGEDSVICHHIGLSNVHDRLKHMFGENCRMDLSSRPFEQTRVLISIYAGKEKLHDTTDC